MASEALPIRRHPDRSAAITPRTAGFSREHPFGPEVGIAAGDEPWRTQVRGPLMDAVAWTSDRRFRLLAPPAGLRKSPGSLDFRGTIVHPRKAPRTATRAPRLSVSRSLGLALS
jgi:hypothetical protein